MHNPQLYDSQQVYYRYSFGTARDGAMTEEERWLFGCVCIQDNRALCSRYQVHSAARRPTFPVTVWDFRRYLLVELYINFIGNGRKFLYVVRALLYPPCRYCDRGYSIVLGFSLCSVSALRHNDDMNY